MRIAIASITYEGIRRNKYELLKILSDGGNDIFVVTPTSDSINNELGKHYAVRIEPHGKNPVNDYSLYKQYLSVYKQIMPDMVLNLTIKPNVYSGLACQKLNIPYIGTINGVGDAIYNGGLLSKITLMLLKIGLRKSECVFFQNEKNRELFITNNVVHRNNTRLVPGSGINVALHPYEEYPNYSDPIVLTFIGRVSKDKGINELIDAAGILKSRGANIKINIVGGCPDSFKEFIGKAHDKGLINYIGRVEPSAIHGILKDSHAVLLPSYHEGIANVLLEGGACGRPIIASFAEGCEETFDDGISGIGFEPKSTESLVAAIEKFMSMTNEERKMMGIRAHDKVVTEFNRDIVDSAYIEAINNIGGRE